jgi:hypothetical protein
MNSSFRIVNSTSASFGRYTESGVNTAVNGNVVTADVATERGIGDPLAAFAEGYLPDTLFHHTTTGRSMAVSGPLADSIRNLNSLGAANGVDGVHVDDLSGDTGLFRFADDHSGYVGGAPVTARINAGTQVQIVRAARAVLANLPR